MTPQDKLFALLCIIGLIVVGLSLVALLRFPVRPLMSSLPKISEPPRWEQERRTVEMQVRCRVEGNEIVVEIGDAEGKTLASHKVHPSMIEKAGWVRK